MWSNLPGNIEQNIELVIESSLCSIKFMNKAHVRLLGLKVSFYFHYSTLMHLEMMVF